MFLLLLQLCLKGGELVLGVLGRLVHRLHGHAVHLPRFFKLCLGLVQVQLQLFGRALSGIQIVGDCSSFLLCSFSSSLCHSQLLAECAALAVGCL